MRELTAPDFARALPLLAGSGQNRLQRRSRLPGLVLGGVK